jgi:hypothetical protein
MTERKNRQDPFGSMAAALALQNVCIQLLMNPEQANRPRDSAGFVRGSRVKVKAYFVLPIKMSINMYYFELMRTKLPVRRNEFLPVEQAAKGKP